MLSRFKTRVFIVVALEILVSIIAGFIIGPAAATLAVGMLIINFVCIYQVFRVQEKDNKKRIFSITRILGNDAKDAFNFGKIGIVTYDEKGIVT